MPGEESVKPSEEQEKNFVQGTLDVTVQSTDINVNRVLCQNSDLSK